MSDIVVIEATQLLDVETGELLPATVDNAARVLDAARTMKARINGIVSETTRFLLHESQVQGAKTLHAAGHKVELSGGPTIDYDTTDLMDALRAAGCPEDRIAQAVVEEITYKPNRSVLKQLAAANPEYRAAIESAERVIEKPWRASVK